MKKLLLLSAFILSVLSISGCFDSYSVYRIPYNDSIVVSQWHEHVHFDEKNHCIFVPKEILYFTDTLEIKIPIEVYYYKSNKRVEPVNYAANKKSN